jgi:molybdopterin synthase catalytic subunit
LREICAEVRREIGAEFRIAIIHRVGLVSVGECSIAIGVSSAHRDEAYRASRFIIEQVKHRIPIWKKEIYHDGEGRWLEGCSLCRQP